MSNDLDLGLDGPPCAEGVETTGLGPNEDWSIGVAAFCVNLHDVNRRCVKADALTAVMNASSPSIRRHPP